MIMVLHRVLFTIRAQSLIAFFSQLFSVGFHPILAELLNLSFVFEPQVVVYKMRGGRFQLDRFVGV